MKRTYTAPKIAKVGDIRQLIQGGNWALDVDGSQIFKRDTSGGGGGGGGS